MNYFTDNQDLAFIFRTSGLSDIVRMYEDNFSQSTRYDYAPASVEDALENYRKILEVTGDIAANIIAPLSQQIDREPHLLDNGRLTYSAAFQHCLNTLCQAELMGCTLSRKFGGLNLPSLIFTMLVEIISQADASLQNIFGLQGIGFIIEAFADEALKEKYLPRLASGQATGAMALTEDEAGSDLQKVKLRADEQPDGTWRLNGVKRFITNGGAAVLLVLARSEPGTADGLGLSLFLCEGDATVTVRRLEDKLGIHGSPTCEVHFHNTPAWLVGERQRGLVTYVLALLNGARLATAAQAIGIAQAAFNEALGYARVRKQYGRRIETLPAVAEMLTNMQISIEAARALAYETARVMDLSIGTARQLAAGDTAGLDSRSLKKDAKRYERLAMLLTSCAKYFCSEMSNRVTYDAIQVMGGSGYMRDYPVERYYRDARITTIYEGTSQMQVLSALRGIMGNTMEKYFEELSAVPWPAQQASLARKLAQARKIMARALAVLEGKKNTQLLELYSRKIVDMATDTLIGYLLLRQSVHSARKLKIARKAVTELLPVIKMRAAQVQRADMTCLKEYAVITSSGTLLK